MNSGAVSDCCNAACINQNSLSDRRYAIAQTPHMHLSYHFRLNLPGFA